MGARVLHLQKRTLSGSESERQGLKLQEDKDDNTEKTKEEKNMQK